MLRRILHRKSKSYGSLLDDSYGYNKPIPDRFEKLRAEAYEAIKKEQEEAMRMQKEYETKGKIKRRKVKRNEYPTLWSRRVYLQDGKIVTNTAELAGFNPGKECYSCRDNKENEFRKQEYFHCQVCGYRCCHNCWVDEQGCFGEKSCQSTCKRCLMMVLTYGRWIRSCRDLVSAFYIWSPEFVEAVWMQEQTRFPTLDLKKKKEISESQVAIAGPPGWSAHYVSESLIHNY